jgi:hypothetical protein
MHKPLFPLVLTVLLTACGGGGGGAASVTPAAQSPNLGASSGQSLSVSTGTIAAGYIECDTAVNIAAQNDCNGYANMSNGSFAFTAIAATASGAPIAQQLVNGSSLTFPNGAYRVAESPADVPALIAVSGGPWPAPGSVLDANGTAYGNRFFVTCIARGTAHLVLQRVDASGTTALPLATTAFPSNNDTVNCSASGSLIVF